MRLNAKWNRRGFLGTMGAIAASLAAPARLFSANRGSSTTSATVSGFGQTGDPYEDPGVTTLINCEGPMTMLGGSFLRPELEAVMAMAGRHFASMPELEVAEGNVSRGVWKSPKTTR